MEKALDDCLVAFKERRGAAQGTGLSAALCVPGWEGNMWVKWLRRIEVGDQPWNSREETSKYTDLLANGRANGHLGDGCEIRRHQSPPAGAAEVTRGRGVC
jgi:sulfane dehydrogenase subunit SoxC